MDDFFFLTKELNKADCNLYITQLPLYCQSAVVVNRLHEIVIIDYNFELKLSGNEQ